MSSLHSRKNAPIRPSRTSSLRTPISGLSRSSSPAGISIYNGISDRPMGWKSTRAPRNPILNIMGRDMNMKRWDGAARRSTEWDGLRRDPELWYPEGNCFIHLYGRGQSRRGPAFRVPFDALLATNCRPLLDRFLVERFTESPISDISSNEDGGYFSQPTHRQFDLYIPAPPTAERGQAFLYHTATRNFFAWIFGKSLVGNHLGGALVGLLNSMNEFRSIDEDNIQAIMDYMDEEGYADMRNQPDHALAILFFAEHFRFKDLWIDAFAHCTGMNDVLITSAGFEHMTRQTRAFITRSRLEMDMRLDQCARKLSSFLSDDLSEAYLNLSPAARAHMDKFRTFLQSYYVAKLGYYPPASPVTGSATFPKNIYRQMCTEFQKLFDLLVDSELTASDTPPVSRQGGLCILQSVQAFDKRNKYQTLRQPFPLLPEVEDASTPKPNKRFSWVPKQDKMKPDGRLVTFSSLTKATNRKNVALCDCSLVRAYRGFEKECVFSPTKGDKLDKLSQTEGRKVRWLLIYSILQTLRSATQVPEEVRDVQNVPYNLCVLTAGTPTWKDERPIDTLLRTQTDQTKEDYLKSTQMPQESDPVTAAADELKPDIDYFALMHRPQQIRTKSESSLANFASKRGTVRKALSSLGNMPELHHPRPKRASFHEILVHGYGNGTNKVQITTGRAASVGMEQQHNRKLSSESDGSSDEGISSRWSNSSYEAGDLDSPRSSVSSQSRRGSDSSIEVSKKTIDEFLDRPMSSLGLARVSSSVYSESIYDDDQPSRLQPSPLQIKMQPSPPEVQRKMQPEDYDYYMTITSDVKVEFQEHTKGMAHRELLTYISA